MVIAIAFVSGNAVTEEQDTVIGFGFVKPMGQWTSDNIRYVCNKHLPDAACYLVDDDPNYRYRPRYTVDEL